MQKIWIILLCWLLPVIYGYAEPQKLIQKSDHPDYAKLIEPDKLKEDLDFLFKTIEEVHPNMYAYTTKQEFEPLKKQLYEKISKPISPLDFYKAAAPVVASLRNGHTFLQPPFEFFQDYAKAGGKYFPIEIQIDEESVILTKYQGPYALPIGAEVLALDGISAPEFLRKAARYMPSEGKAYNLAMIQRQSMLPIYLWLEKSDAELLDLQLKTTNGRIEQFHLKALGYEELVNYQNSSYEQALCTIIYERYDSFDSIDDFIHYALTHIEVTGEGNKAKFIVMDDNSQQK